MLFSKKKFCFSDVNYHRPGILQVLPSLISGGVERGVVEISAALNGSDFSSFVASAGGPMTSQIFYNGSKHFTLPLASKNPWQIYLNYLSLSKIIQSNNIKIVHARSRAPAWSAYFAARANNCKFVTTFHGIYSFTNIFKKFYNSIMTKGHKVIAVSNFVADHIKQNYSISNDNLVVIHRGADLDYFNPLNVSEERIVQLINKLFIPTDKPLILFPGRLTRWKGHEFFLKSLLKLRTQDYNCIIVGDDKGHSFYRKHLESLIKQYSLQDKVSIINHVGDMPALYMLADLVVATSTSPEAFGRIAIEAQSMKRLFITTNIGGACETVKEGNGWLVAPDDIESLSSLIDQALSLDLDQKQLIGSKARLYIEQNFSLEKMTHLTIQTYSKLLES